MLQPNERLKNKHLCHMSLNLIPFFLSFLKNYYFYFNFFDERSIFPPTLIGFGDTKRNKEREKIPAEKHTVLSQVGTLTLVSLALWKRRQENHLDSRPEDRLTGKVSQG